VLIFFRQTVETEDEDLVQLTLASLLSLILFSTGNEQRDGHVKSADFYDAGIFPELSFDATKCENVYIDGYYEFHGGLTIKDVTKAVKLSVEIGGIVKDPYGNTETGFSINDKINRKDFGLIFTWRAVTEAGGIVVSDEVRIVCEIQLIEKQ